MLQRVHLDERCRMNVPGRRAAEEPRVPGEGAGCPEATPCPAEVVVPLRSPEARSSPAATRDPQVGEKGDGPPPPPPYFPQPEDKLPRATEETMGPIGPWATGRPTFSPMSGITGVRPVVDRYSVTHMSTADWRARNKTFIDQSEAKIREARLAASNAKECTDRVYKETDENQLANRDRLSVRAGAVHRWKGELERVLLEMTDEIELLEGERRRVKRSLSVLTVPESIAGEFLQLRSTRLEPDLVRDPVEEELIKEVALCAKLKDQLIKTREEIERQSLELKTAKSRMEFDWTDKKDAYGIDANCVGLANDSPLILWKPGAARFPAEQSTPESYARFTDEALAAANEARRKSVALRSTLDAVYVHSVRDLRNQAAKVDAALADKVGLTEQVCQHLEKELLKCLHELAETEELIETLRGSTRKLDLATKVAQTRLDDRLLRRNVESCRDEPQFGLIEEVKTLGENVTAMRAQLQRAEDAQAGLIKARSDLEREIIVKRKSLYVDRDRGQLLRSFYPSAEALSGHSK